MGEMAILFMMIGGLIPTFLVSRLLLWIMRSWDGGIARLAVVHTFSWFVMAFVGGMGMADGGAFAGIEAAMLYFAPQAVWLLVDILRHKRKLRQSIKTA